MVETLFPRENTWFLQALGKSWKDIFIKNKEIIREASRIVNHISPSTVIMFKDNDPITCKIIEIASKKATKIVLVQEGLGIYRLPSLNVKKMLQTKAPFLLGYPKVYSWVQGMNPHVDVIAVTDRKKLSKTKQKNKTIIDIPNILPPSPILHQFIQSVSSSFSPVQKLDANIILYLGQPLSRLGMAKQEEDLFLESLLTSLKNTKYTIVIKPHPNDDLSKYLKYKSKEIIILDPVLPAEFLPLYMKVDYVLTVYSSAADNIASWYKIPAIYLHEILNKQRLKFMDDLNGVFIQDFVELEIFIKPFSFDFHEGDMTRNDQEAEKAYKHFIDQIMTREKMNRD